MPSLCCRSGWGRDHRRQRGGERLLHPGSGNGRTGGFQTGLFDLSRRASRRRVGPALANEQFLSVSPFQTLIADLLYKVMSTQMPANAPRSLSETQHLDILASIPEVNGYPAGPRQPTGDDQTPDQIKIGPTGRLRRRNGSTEEAQ
jgi:hypothetical protein